MSCQVKTSGANNEIKKQEYFSLPTDSVIVDYAVYCFDVMLTFHFRHVKIGKLGMPTLKK
jgi:hypothetical protein